MRPCHRSLLDGRLRRLRQALCAVALAACAPGGGPAEPGADVGDSKAHDTLAPLDTRAPASDALAPGCTDPHEPNDWPVMATPAPSLPVAGVVCPGDVDLFALPAGTGGVVAARLVAQSPAGASLRLALLTMPSLTALPVTVVAEGAWEDDTLGFVAPVEPALLTFVRVDAASTAGPVPYQLELQVEHGGCIEDPHEPNDAPGEAEPLGLTVLIEAVVCVTDVDWWSLDVPPDTHVRITATPKQQSASLALHGEVGDEELASFPRPSGGAAVAVAAAPGPRRLLLRVAPTDPAVVHYDLRTESWPVTPPVQGTITGTVRYEDRMPTRNGYLAGTWLPAPRVAVEAVRAFDEQVVASTWTDHDGAFTIDATLDGPPQVRLRALTEVHPDAPAVSLRTDVAPGSGPIAVSSPELVLTPAGATVDVLAHAQGGGGAFNALDVAGRSLALMEGVLGAPAVPLALAWRPGWTDPCGTCYFGALGVLTLSGTAADDDAYDDAVVAHEAAHHFEMAHGVADSPGGYHDGRRTDPRVAWSEGFANAFAAMVLNDPLYVDVRALGATLVLDIESVSHEQSYGTSDGTMSGAVSEDLVAAVLWDLVDAGPEALDPASGPLSMTLETSLSWLPTAARGFPGVDLVDHLDGLLCLDLAPATSVDAVAVQQRKFPYDLAPVIAPAGLCD